MTLRHRLLLYQSLVLLWTGAAFAHDLDISRSEFVVQNGSVQGHVEVASRDAMASDAGAPEELSTLIRDHTEVMLGSSKCTAAIDKAWNIDRDGTAVDVTFTCPETSNDLSV